MDDVTHILDKKSGPSRRSGQCDLQILDFSKAFDKVPHWQLAYKLNWYGIRGQTLAWIEDFLRGQTQQVLLDGETSTTRWVTSGVPQDTVLGPCLFLTYINDLPECIHNSHVWLFADDCVI